MLQSIPGCKSFSWASSWVPVVLVFVGDQPFIRHLIGVATSPQVGSIYNMGVWDKAAAAWLRVDVRWTWDNEAAARHQYQVTGRSLDNWGCIAEPHHGGRSWSGPDPKGGGGGALRTPKLWYGTMCFVGAGDFRFRHRAGGKIFVRPYVSVLKILKISWRIQKWLKSTKKDFDPDPASGSDLG